MTREEFQKIVDEVTGGEYHPPVRENKTNGIVEQKGYFGPTVKIREKWLTGGDWGGNCWSNERTGYGPDPEPEPELTQLDAILEKIAPTISFLHYKQLMKKVTYDSHTKYEYYGNHTSYGIKEILVEDIWQFLKEHGDV
jgi:hypothetical protein